MFENTFNSKKTDPLVEAVKVAQQDGEYRRQATALVNEHFGVFNRNAVIRENLAAYDAAIEEAYKCMKEGEKWEGSKKDTDEDKKLAKKHGMTLAQWEKSDADKKHDAKEKHMKEGTPENIMNPNSDWAKKQAADKSNPFNQPTPNPTEVAPNIMMRGNTQGGSSSMVDKVKSLFKEGKKLADKDYDKDGKIESPKDEVWGSRLRAAKLAGKLKEGAVDAGDYEGSKSVTKSAPKEDPSTPKVPYSELPKTGNRAGAVIDSAKGAMREAKLDEISTKLATRYTKKSFKDMKQAADFGDTMSIRNRAKGIGMASKKLTGGAKVPANEEALAEAVSRKHFQQVADLIKGHESQEKRNELATHHAGIFAKQNPRFDHARFHAAAGSTAHQVKTVKESVLAVIRARHMKEDSSFNAAQDSGKPVNEIAMTTPPAIVQPAVPGVKQTQSVRPSASFARQGAGARPLTPTSQSVSSAMKSPSFMNTSKLSSAASKVADVGSKAATVASKAPGVAARIAGLAARVNPVAGAAMAGATASQALGKLATGTETGRAIGKSIGRAINPPVSTLPKSEPTPAAAPKPSTVAIKKGDTMTGIAKAQGTTVSDLAKANPDIKDVNKIGAGKSLNLPKPAYTPKPVDQAATIKQSGGEPSVQTGTAAPKAAPTPPARPADLGKTTAPSAPAASASVPTPPSRPAELDLPKIDKGPSPGPASAPNPKVDVPTPPSRPADLGSSEAKPMQNPDQERTKAKTVSESVVTVGDNKYRIL